MKKIIHSTGNFRTDKFSLLKMELILDILKSLEGNLLGAGGGGVRGGEGVEVILKKKKRVLLRF